MPRWGGLVPVLALASGLARAAAEVLALPGQEVEPNVDPVTFALYLEPRQRPVMLSRLGEFANSPFGRSAGWLARALAYGTVCDILVVRWLFQRVLGHNPFEPQGQAAQQASSHGRQAQPPSPAPLASGHEQHRRGGRGAVDSDRGYRPLLAAALLASLAVSAALVRAASRRRRHEAGLVPAPGAKAASGRACVTELPHGLVQRRLQTADGSAARGGSRGTVKHVTWRSESEWLRDEGGMPAVLEEGSNSQSTQFFRICSEAPQQFEDP